jgi:hypothetical protein
VLGDRRRKGDESTAGKEVRGEFSTNSQEVGSKSGVSLSLFSVFLVLGMGLCQFCELCPKTSNLSFVQLNCCFLCLDPSPC